MRYIQSSLVVIVKVAAMHTQTHTHTETDKDFKTFYAVMDIIGLTKKLSTTVE